MLFINFLLFNLSRNNYFISFVLYIVLIVFYYCFDAFGLDTGGDYCFILPSISLYSPLARRSIRARSFQDHFESHMKLIEEQGQQLSPSDLSKEHFHLSMEDITKLDVKYNYNDYLTFFQHPELNFAEWLVGFTDGDGDFAVSLRQATDNVNYNTIHEFRVTQSLYNIQSLLFIQANLGCGNIRPLHPSGKTNRSYPGVRFVDWVYRFTVQDKFNIGNIVIPLFNSYPLLTVKYYYYSLFHSMFFETNPISLRLHKDSFQTIPAEYTANHNNELTKSWLVGFIEAYAYANKVRVGFTGLRREGSFFLSNNRGNFNHEFSINQSTDVLLLLHIKDMFNITSEISSERASGSVLLTHKLRTSSKSSIMNIIKYLDNHLVGAKRFEFKLWADSFYAINSNQPYDLRELQLYMRLLRDRHKVMLHLKRKAQSLPSNSN